MTQDLTADRLTNLRSVVLVCYAIYAVALFTALPIFVGVVIAYWKRGDAAGTVYASHFSNLIKIFWVTLILGIIGGLLAFIAIGFIILIPLWIWGFWRTAKGALRARDHRTYA